MKHTLCDEAIILRTYNVGESDRFCIVLTRHHGRIAARARGARRLTSRRLGGILPFRSMHVDLHHHASGWILEDARGYGSLRSWHDPRAFAIASRGIEIVLRLTDDEHPLPHLFDATVSFLAACDAPHDLLFSAFSLRVLLALGLLPSALQSCVSGRTLPCSSVALSLSLGGFVHAIEDGASDAIPLAPTVASFCQQAATYAFDALPTCTAAEAQAIDAIVQRLLGSQLGSPLVAPAVCAAIEAGIPTCHVSGRAS